MSNQQHPITPPPLVREQWHLESPFKVISLEREDYMIDRAAQWGADQEREASLEWLEQEGYLDACHSLGATRRPKPPSDKELALATLQRVSKDQYPCNYQDDEDWDTIRRALEQLPDALQTP